jgi:hypothetical protein
VGVLNAPVDCSCSFSKSSCSSLGRRGGDGEGDHDVCLAALVVSVRVFVRAIACIIRRRCIVVFVCYCMMKEAKVKWVFRSALGSFGRA